MITTNSVTMLIPQGKTASVTSIEGTATMNLSTNGKVLVCNNVAAPRREKPYVISETRYGQMYVSPRGQRTTVKMILPTSQASEEEFFYQLHRLYMKMAGSGCCC